MNVIQERIDQERAEERTEEMRDEHLTTAELLGRSSGPVGKTVQAQERSEPLFVSDEADKLRSRWHDIQGSFVDEPKQAVQQADELVAATIKRLAEIFADERSRLEHEWSQGQDVSTEDFRLALRRYRSFFDRLLTV